MGLAQDLLLQARHLAAYEGQNATQAALRRAVSTAYYALFQLLIEDAAKRWTGSPSAVTGIERAFNHGQMKNSSVQFQNPQWIDWNGEVQVVPSALRRVANSFPELQQERLAADYNNLEQWTASDVETVLTLAEKAFTDWLSIRTQPIAGDYLLSMLVGKFRQ